MDGRNLTKCVLYKNEFIVISLIVHTSRNGIFPNGNVTMYPPSLPRDMTMYPAEADWGRNCPSIHDVPSHPPPIPIHQQPTSSFVSKSPRPLDSGSKRRSSRPIPPSVIHSHDPPPRCSTTLRPLMPIQKRRSPPRTTYHRGDMSVAQGPASQTRRRRRNTWLSCINRGIKR